MFFLGDITCSWKTLPRTAIEGTDYVRDAGTIFLAAGQRSTSIDLTILDSGKPELNKTFGVELYDAKQGGKVQRKYDYWSNK